MGITSIPQSLCAPWTRKDDKPGRQLFPRHAGNLFSLFASLYKFLDTAVERLSP